MLRFCKTLILCGIILLTLAGCSTKAVMNGKGSQNTRDERISAIFQKGPSEQQAFDEILNYLSNDGKEPKYSEARVRLEEFLERFPDGKWTPAARSLIVCVDRITALQAQWKQERQKYQSENGKLIKEIEGLRGGVRQSDEKTVAEVLRLQQENEQLKKDIQQLKNLEIQLEKREKMLR